MVKFDRSSRRLSTSPLQALLYLVSKVSRHPIEVIVSVFVLVTLAYFVLLRAIATVSYTHLTLPTSDLV